MSLSQTKKPSQEKTEAKKESALQPVKPNAEGYAPSLGVITEQRLYLNSLSTYQWAKAKDIL
jgi:hypothetical protein